MSGVIFKAGDRVVVNIGDDETESDLWVGGIVKEYVSDDFIYVIVDGEEWVSCAADLKPNRRSKNDNTRIECGRCDLPLADIADYPNGGAPQYEADLAELEKARAFGSGETISNTHDMAYDYARVAEALSRMLPFLKDNGLLL